MIGLDIFGMYVIDVLGCLYYINCALFINQFYQKTYGPGNVVPRTPPPNLSLFHYFRKSTEEKHCTPPLNLSLIRYFRKPTDQETTCQALRPSTTGWSIQDVLKHI
jgi:hypothetical protein